VSAPHGEPVVAFDRGAQAGGIESVLAGVLAEVLGVDRVPADAHFFDELRADSLRMAHFCARVRKRGGLPSISMRDVYAHPTIARLAAALAASAASTRPAPVRALEPQTATRAGEYLLCGVLQALFYLGYLYLGVLAGIEGFERIVGDAQGLEGYLRLVLFSGVTFLVLCAVPIAAKWLLIGRWQRGSIRLWSLGYVRFWIVKTLIRSNPGIYLFVGSPLYGLYLRALGAHVGPGAVIFSRRVPICTDLLSIGAGTVIRREVMLNCYRAQAGRIEIGPVNVGRDAYVGETSVLEIGTSMGDGAQLGHSSALLSGQSVPGGERWHGSPAQRTEVNYARVPPAECGTWRRARYSILTLLAIFLVYVPLFELGVTALFVGVASLVEMLDPGVQANGALTVHGLLLESLAFSIVLFFGAGLVGLLAVGIVPRALSPLIKPDTVYPLYGFHHSVHRVIAWFGRLEFFPLMFGDSSYIVRYLGWLGFRLKPVVQTGSNFGSEVNSAHPLLTSVGTGTMVADGLSVINDEVSNTSFRLSRVAIGSRNFLGNDVIYPAGGATGDNVLLANKVMVPIDGKVRTGVGLLGSPPFEIPRSVERDSRFDHLRTGEALRRGLAAKDRFNRRTIGIFLLTRWLGILLVTVIDLAAIELFFDAYGHTLMTALFAASAVLAALYYALVEGAFEKLSPPPPEICSIYDSRFWWVERIWKLHPIYFLNIFDGTPFKNLLWRVIGVRLGRRVFDNGAYFSEPLLTTIGDECVFNERSKIQCDSQEDGTYKSGRTTLGARCTIGTGAFVHYGVTMGDGAALAADAFLMKGELVPGGARWAGNPAREA
jgi:non-ribosomal peptide synthetase-like protein